MFDAGGSIQACNRSAEALFGTADRNRAELAELIGLGAESGPSAA
jgi:hypothetical protein